MKTFPAFPLWITRHENDFATGVLPPRFLSEHKPINLRHNDVTDKNVRRALLHSQQGQAGVVEGLDFEPSFCKSNTHHVGNLTFIVDNEYFLFQFPFPFRDSQRCR